MAQTRMSALIGFLAALCAACAGAQSWPARPIRMIVPLPAGTASDFLARTLATPLSDAYKHQLVVDNRPGAGGLIGSTIASKSTPDGYTFAMIAPPHTVAPLLQANPPYHPIKDFTLVSVVALIPNVLVVAPNLPAKNVKELVSLLRANPGKYNYASVGVGTLAHIAGEIFNRAAGVKTVHVPFKVLGDAFSETMADRVHYFLFTVPSASGIVRDGRLRAIATSGSKRSVALPDLPTLSEAGLPDATSDGWFGIVGPAGIPRAVVKQFSSDVAKLVREQRIRDAFAKGGAEPAADSTPESFAKLMQSEYDRYVTLIREAGIRQQ